MQVETRDSTVVRRKHNVPGAGNFSCWLLRTVSSYTKLHTTISVYGLIVGDEDEIVNYVSR